MSNLNWANRRVFKSKIGRFDVLLLGFHRAPLFLRPALNFDLESPNKKGGSGRWIGPVRGSTPKCDSRKIPSTKFPTQFYI